MATQPEGIQTAPEPARRMGAPQVLGILIGLLLLLVVIWFLFLRGDDTPEETATPAPVTEEQPPVEEPASTPGNKSPVETFEVFAPKDPFDPLISASAGSGAATATVTTTGAPTTATTITSTDPAGTSGTGVTTTTTTTTGDSGDGGGESVGGHRVRVIDVFAESGDRRAQIQVDGTVYTVDEGERFAQNFQLLSTSGRCATMLFGDDEFTLCEGEEILK